MSIPKVGISLEVEEFGTYDESNFKESYDIEDELNCGSYGTVYTTTHKSSDELYAVKLIPCSCVESIIETKKEADLMRCLSGIKNVIHLIDFFIDDVSDEKKNIYIVQDLAKGGDVFDKLASKEQYTEKDARDLCFSLITTVAHIHKQGIVHRDLKLENLVLKDYQSDTQLLVCDFGLARKLPKDGKSMHSFCGTPAYTAPEIICSYPYREKVDNWSIGCILFMILSGAFPFGDQDSEDLYERIEDGDFSYDDESWDEVSGSAKKVITKLLKVKAKSRWSLDEAIEANWFAKSQIVKLQGSSLNKSLKGIKRFVAKRKFRAAMHVVTLSQRGFATFSKPALQKPAITLESIDDVDEGDEIKIDNVEEKLMNTYTLYQVQHDQVKNMDKSKKEQYLKDEDFQTVFKTTRDEFESWTPFQKKKAKAAAKLL